METDCSKLIDGSNDKCCDTPPDEEVLPRKEEIA